MDFLKLSPVCGKCSLLHANIPAGEDNIVCISEICAIVNRQSEFKFLISIPDNFTTNNALQPLIPT